MLLDVGLNASQYITGLGALVSQPGVPHYRDRVIPSGYWSYVIGTRTVWIYLA
jgi:hypothetical protein